jgi:hypothetical protein
MCFEKLPTIIKTRLTEETIMLGEKEHSSKGPEGSVMVPAAEMEKIHLLPESG